jgi:hypothetical protein
LSKGTTFGFFGLFFFAFFLTDFRLSVAVDDDSGPRLKTSLILCPRRAKLVDRAFERSDVVGEVELDVDDFARAFFELVRFAALQWGHTCHSTFGESSDAGEDTDDEKCGLGRTGSPFVVWAYG